MFLTLNMEFISLLRHIMIFLCFHSCFALVKISKIRSHWWSKFHIQRQTIEYPLFIKFISSFIILWYMYLNKLICEDRSIFNVAINYFLKYKVLVCVFIIPLLDHLSSPMSLKVKTYIPIQLLMIYILCIFDCLSWEKLRYLMVH